MLVGFGMGLGCAQWTSRCPGRCRGLVVRAASLGPCIWSGRVLMRLWRSGLCLLVGMLSGRMCWLCSRVLLIRLVRRLVSIRSIRMLMCRLGHLSMSPTLSSRRWSVLLRGFVIWCWLGMCVLRLIIRLVVILLVVL